MSAIIPAPPKSLGTEESLSTYLLKVASRIRRQTGSAEVAIYLVDPATERLGLRAWQSDARSGSQADPDAPTDLTDHGIEGSSLSAKTLQRFVRTAPEGKRLAKTLGGVDSWFGALIGVAATTFSSDAVDVFAKAAAELGSALEKSAVRATRLEAESAGTSEDTESEPIFGHGVSTGTAYAAAAVHDMETSRGPAGHKIEESREDAVVRLDRAIGNTRAQLEKLTTDVGNDLYDVVSLLFSTHVLMLADDSFSGAMRSLVLAGQTPEDAVQSVVATFVRTFGNLREARLAETAQDVRDIGFRLRQNLASRDGSGEDFSDRIVLLEDALPSDLIRVAVGNAAGVVILGAAVTAHIAILARSLGLPTLITEDRTALEIVDDTMILLDADGGRLYVTPSRSQVAEFGHDPGEGSRPHKTAGPATVAAAGAEPASSPAHMLLDGQPLSIMVNVNLLSDARRGAEQGADGIGLYRSEFPFIIRNDFISEEEQYRIYRAIVQAMPGKPVILRTADIGGDKLMAGREEERNPFLGVRGIRFSLANRNLFQRQLRAMLRAGAGADLGIMFPMVASQDELEDAREEVLACMESLRRDGLEHNGTPKVGAMVELPSAVIQIEEFAARTDFLSIGTNDLIMYLLAVDRTNERLSELYRSHHPVVLRTLAEISRRVGDRIDQLSVCGESAADPLMIPFYLGIGIRKLSVAPGEISSVASLSARWDGARAKELASQMLSLGTLRQMDAFLRDFDFSAAS